MSDNRPLDVLEASLGDEVTVRLKGGEIYEGSLTGYDQHLNVVLEAAARTDTGVEDLSDPEEWGDTTIIRGDNVVSVTA